MRANIVDCHGNPVVPPDRKDAWSRPWAQGDTVAETAVVPAGTVTAPTQQTMTTPAVAVTAAASYVAPAVAENIVTATAAASDVAPAVASDGKSRRPQTKQPWLEDFPLDSSPDFVWASAVLQREAMPDWLPALGP